MNTWRRIMICGCAAGLLWTFPAAADTMPAGAQGAYHTFSVKSETGSYDNIAISKVSGTVNIREAATTSSAVVGKIYNDCAAIILETVDGEGGQWYKIQSGSVTGYMKAEYFVTGEAAAAKAKEVGTTYGVVSGTTSLRLREKPDTESKTLTLLAEGARYTVSGEEGDFYKLSIDMDLEGYASKQYMKTEVEFKEAVSLAEEQEQAADQAKRQEEAQAAIAQLEEIKATVSREAPSAGGSGNAGSSSAGSANGSSSGASGGSTIIAANPEQGNMVTVAPPAQGGVTGNAGASGTGAGSGSAGETPSTGASGSSSSSAAGGSTTVISPAGTGGSPSASGGPGTKGEQEIASATRTAVVAYAKQFLGNPYVYGGTSLTNGADCSGFVMSVFSHFGINTGRSSRDQAAKGREIPVDSVRPGDLLFYASGDYINHVGIYIGGGQIIHASTPATGICLAPSNYRTPAKAATFLD